MFKTLTISGILTLSSWKNGISVPLSSKPKRHSETTKLIVKSFYFLWILSWIVFNFMAPSFAPQMLKIMSYLMVFFYSSACLNKVSIALVNVEPVAIVSEINTVALSGRQSNFW